MPPPLSTADLETCAAVRATCACNQLRRAARAMTQRYERALASSGLKATQLPILVGLSHSRPVPLTRLAEGLALDRTTLTRNLRVLEQAGLVTTVADATDARVRLVALTDAGARLLADALVIWRELQVELEREFGAPRLRALAGELSSLTDAVQA
jgi:DNA-binding MarR family transcriptional regulator